MSGRWSCRRLPATFGKARIYVSAEGGLRYLKRDLSDVDPPLLQLAADVVRPGQVVWDVGANVGLFSFAAASAAGSAGHVLAIEADAALAGLLRRSAAANPAHAPVQVLSAAVSDEVSVARFHIARRNRATSHLDGYGTTMTGGVRYTELVPTVTLDWLALHFPAPDVLKIDVEGLNSPSSRALPRCLATCRRSSARSARVTPPPWRTCRPLAATVSTMASVRPASGWRSPWRRRTRWPSLQGFRRCPRDPRCNRAAGLGLSGQWRRCGGMNLQYAFEPAPVFGSSEDGELAALDVDLEQTDPASDRDLHVHPGLYAIVATRHRFVENHRG
jgi:FkbM family methyltransferase